LLSLALALAACGGGGGDGGSSPTTPTPTTNQPPAFTSAATASVTENSDGTIYTATARDPDDAALTFALGTTGDSALFRITSGGALSFATPPDFEAPADANADNVYQVQLSVTDGKAAAVMLDLAVTVTNAGPDGFRVRRVATGFAQPLYVAPVTDGSGRVYVVEKGGLIRLLDPATGTIATTPFLDVRTQISTDGERGLLGFATAPDFATSRRFYVYLTNGSGGIEIRRYRTTANPDVADGTTAETLITIPHPTNTNHNGGWIGFGPDGFLYAGIGDGGGSGDPSDNAQNRNVLLGKILRLDVSSDGFPTDGARNYAIPATNPFATTGGAPEIWAYGVRNPFRMSFDNTNLLVGDVGQDAVEEIDLLRAGDGGANLGWATVEGTRNNKGTASPSFTVPVAEYGHGSGPTQGDSLTGGYVYRGPVEALRGQYFFADFVSNNIWSLPLARLVPGTTRPASEFIQRTAAFTPATGAITSISSFGLDSAGNLYIVSIGGSIFRVEAM
jgi:glucose/arabinose dehydrogenase